MDHLAWLLEIQERQDLPQIPGRIPAGRMGASDAPASPLTRREVLEETAASLLRALAQGDAARQAAVRHNAGDRGGEASFPMGAEEYFSLPGSRDMLPFSEGAASSRLAMGQISRFFQRDARRFG